MALPTLTDLKSQTNIASTADDDELADMLDAAVDVVAGIVGPIDEPATVTETHYDVSGSVLVLKRMPVGELVSVSSRYGATTTLLTLGDYELDAATGLVRMASGGRFCGTYTVSYTSGRDNLPAAIRLAVLVVAEHLWQTQRGPSPVGPLAAEEDTFSTPGLGFAIPNRARELLAPYIRPAIA